MVHLVEVQAQAAHEVLKRPGHDVAFSEGFAVSGRGGELGPASQASDRPDRSGDEAADILGVNLVAFPDRAVGLAEDVDAP